jgi:2-amino-4-hydroxy-6-hydroxymethyldihydropteridine diphosphokinase
VRRRAYLSLGTNLGDRIGWLGAARATLIARTDLRLTALSPVVETDPVDVTDQPKFLNQVVAIDTDLPARSLLDACLETERELGRDRTVTPRRGPRTIDVDLLLFDGETIDEPGLTVPHPRLAARPFFLDLCRAAGAPAAWLPATEPA